MLHNHDDNSTFIISKLDYRSYSNNCSHCSDNFASKKTLLFSAFLVFTLLLMTVILLHFSFKHIFAREVIIFSQLPLQFDKK